MLTKGIIMQDHFNAQICSTFALDVYQDIQTETLPQHWAYHSETTDEHQNRGYFARVFISEIAPQQLAVVIANRGTDDWYDIMQDAAMWLIKKIPSQFFHAVEPFVNHTIKALQDEYPDYQIQLSFTGHSLGATLAQLAMIYFAEQPMSQVTVHPGCVFESPGCEPLVEKLKDDGHIQIIDKDFCNDIRIFNADVNVINTCISQINNVSIAYHVEYDYVPLRNGELPLKPNIFYFFDNFSVKDQHSMQKMHDFIQQSAYANQLAKMPTSHKGDWPSGVISAYKFYKQYQPTEVTNRHMSYWNGDLADHGDGYIHRCWQSQPEIQKDYDHDFKKFFVYFTEEVLKADLPECMNNAEKNLYKLANLEIGYQRQQAKDLPRHIQKPMLKHLNLLEEELQTKIKRAKVEQYSEPVSV